MTWEDELHTMGDDGEGDWSDKSDDDAHGGLAADDEDKEEDGYDIGDDDLKGDDGLVEEELN